MTTTVRRSPLTPDLLPPASPSTPTDSPSGASFRDSLRRVAEGIADDERAMDRALRSGSHGQQAPEALIALQARVYRHTQELELGSKVVDKAAGAVKQTLGKVEELKRALFV